jgi:hypothetical protein
MFNTGIDDFEYCNTGIEKQYLANTKFEKNKKNADFNF